MRGRRPLPPFPGQTAGAASPTPCETSRQRPSPGQPPAEGSRPLPTDRTIDGCPRNPPGRACPAPTARRPGNGCPRKPSGRFHIPIRRAGCPLPAATFRCRPFPGKPQGAASPMPREGSRCRQQQPLPSPLGEGGPAGPDEGQAPAAALPRVITRGDSRCRQHPRRGQDPSLQTHPQTSAHVTPRAGHARPQPRNNPIHLYTT